MRRNQTLTPSEILEELVEPIIGKQCKTKDTDDFPELKWHNSQKFMTIEGNDGRCLVCVTYERIETALTQLDTYYSNLYRDKVMGAIGEKKVFEPTKNMSCSFEMPNDYPNPCNYCGGTRKYEWREFTKKYGLAPDQIDGYNQAITDFKANLDKLWEKKP